MHRHWCMPLILYTVNATACHRCHLVALCPWENHWLSEHFILPRWISTPTYTPDYSRAPMFRHICLVCLTNASIRQYLWNLRLQQLARYDYTTGSGVNKWNKVTLRCYLTILTKWQRLQLHRLERCKNLLIWNTTQPSWLLAVSLTIKE